MANKDVVTSLLIEGEYYHIHAKIVGGFWNGYIVYENEYFLPLPSATNMQTLLDIAKQQVLESRKKKREFQVY